MCGIAGYIDFSKNKFQKKNLISMTSELVHRGPDGYGYWNDEKVGFGHRRLSIIDLNNRSNQPMLNKKKNLILNYNGEIYNFSEIKKNLIKSGYKFSTTSDTEVLLNAWDKWGLSSINKLNGMFAFSIYDKNKNKVFFVRDRYGIKPLYYYKKNNLFLFASEQKAILKHPEVTVRIEKKNLIEYLTFQNFFSNHTLLDNIFIFPAGNYGSIDLNKDTINLEIKKYWDFEFREDTSISYKDYQDQTYNLLKNSVDRQLVSDVKIGSYLSGGIDSAIIVALASKKIKNLSTYTCGFDFQNATDLEIAFDERENAKKIANILGVKNYSYEVHSGEMLKCLKKLSYHLEEPRVGQSYPNYLISKFVSKKVKVVLSGIGADELFGGYPWRYFSNDKIMSHDDFIKKYYEKWKKLLTNREMKNLIVNYETENTNTLEIFSSIFKKNFPNKLRSYDDYINRCLYLETKTFLHGLLIVEDKLSMSHSLETRVPYLDNNFVDFVLKCPLKYKVNKKITKSINENFNFKKKVVKKYYRNKSILREILSKAIDSKIYQSEKRGFTGPDLSWFRNNTKSFLKKFLEKNLLIYKYLEKKTIKKIMISHFKGKDNRRLLIWSILNLEYYLKNLKKNF